MKCGISKTSTRMETHKNYYAHYNFSYLIKCMLTLCTGRVQEGTPFLRPPFRECVICFFLNEMFFSLRPHHVFRISKSSLVHINGCGLKVNGISVLYLFKTNSSLIVVLIPVKDVIIITTRKRSLGQGNIFRSMCQDFCPQGEGVVSQHALQVVSQHALQVSRGGGIPACLAHLQAHTQGGSWGVWPGGGSPGPHPGGLHAHTWGVSRPKLREGVSQQVLRQTPPSRQLPLLKWYASYWNAFLFVETSKEVIATVHLLADWIKFKTYQKSFGSMNRCDVLACTM